MTSAQAVDPTADDGSDVTTGSLKHEIDDLSQQVKDKQNKIKELDAFVNSYQAKIKENENAVSSLQNEVALLDNRIQEKGLAVERSVNEIELTNLELQSIGTQIRLTQNTIVQREASLGELVRRIQAADQVSPVDVFFSRPSLSEFFARIDQIKGLERKLVDATKQLKEEKRSLESKKKDGEDHRLALQDQKTRLEAEQAALERDKSAKTSLVAETQSEENQFQRILYELRQQQQGEADDIAALQDRLKDKLNSIDTALARGDILLSWPIEVKKGISAHFHDPTYPFRKLFEHPGTDLPTPVGTPVHAAAGGYVAWNRTGKQYGNYVMVVHPGGIATVYAHLSRFGAKPDTYVERGDIIGYSGGRPGDEGAGLSTGAHLHFEVRQGGIPVNAENFLPSLN